MVLSSAARRARSLRCHLCSSQAVPSILGSGALITGYAFRRVHHRRAYLWGTVFSQWLCPLLPPALTAPGRWGFREVMVASCSAARFPSSLESRERRRGARVARPRRGLLREAAGPVAPAGVAGHGGTQGRTGCSVRCWGARLGGGEGGRGLREARRGPLRLPRGGGVGQTGTMWRPKLSPCSFMWFPW